MRIAAFLVTTALLVSTSLGCGGDDFGERSICDPGGVTGIIPTVEIGLFDSSRSRICVAPESGSGGRYHGRIEVGREGHLSPSGVGLDRIYAQLTADGQGFTLGVEHWCNASVMSYDGLGLLQSPQCPTAEPLEFFVDIEGCEPVSGAWTVEDNRAVEESISRDAGEDFVLTFNYRIPVVLDCDDTVARWPLGDPHPDPGAWDPDSWRE